MKDFRRKLIFQITVTAIVVAALLGGIIYFGQQIADYSNRVVDLRAQLYRRWSSLATLATLLTQWNSAAQADQAALEHSIPGRNQLLNLNKDFQNLAARTNLAESFSYLDETEPAGPGDLGAISFQLSVTGPFDDLVAFTKALDTFHYLSSFSGLSLGNGGAASHLTVQGRVYYQ